MTTFTVSLTNLTIYLLQSRDNTCYISRPILAPTLLCLQKHTDLFADDFAHCPNLWHEPRFANIAAPEAGEFVELIFLYVVIFHLHLDVFVEW